MQENATYQCINATCGHTMPRVVKFCPYCGTPQQGGTRPVRPASVGIVTPPPSPPPVTVPEPATAVPQVMAPVFVSTPVPPPVAIPPPADIPPPPVRTSAPPAAPPQRQPLHPIWWAIGLAVLWLAWIVARPASHKVDARIDAAISLAQECKGKQAQSELIALRASRATPAQLQRVQTALNEASSTCNRKALREKAWADTRNAIDAALAADNVDRARARLATFTRRWGEDTGTASTKSRIDAAKREQAPAAVASASATPAPSREASRESAINLISEAERDISRGNYKGAIDKMDACVGMVDAGNRDCLALKTKAERLYRGL